MRSPNRYRHAAAIVAGLALSQAFAAPAASEVSFAGKTIRIVVNFPAGGPADAFIRHFQPHIEPRLPGKPTVIVENRPGAAGRVGANYIYNAAPPDGTSIGFLVGLASQDMIGAENVRFEAPKFRWLGAVTQSQVLLAHKSAGVGAPADLLKPAAGLVYAAPGANAINGINSRLFLDMIGAKYKFVTGYPGQANIMQALRQGEVNLTDAGIAAFLPNRASWKQEGLFVPVVQRGVPQLDGTFRRHASIPDLPTMEEAVAEMKPEAMNTIGYRTFKVLVGTYAVHFPLVLPPKTDEATAAALARAMAETFSDPEVRRSATARFKFAYDFFDGAAAQDFVQKLFRDYRSDPQVKTLIGQLTQGK
jgi:tripartite-type tricarboxylate transporter receptor subunit TctC